MPHAMERLFATPRMSPLLPASTICLRSIAGIVTQWASVSRDPHRAVPGVNAHEGAGEVEDGAVALAAFLDAADRQRQGQELAGAVHVDRDIRCPGQREVDRAGDGPEVLVARADLLVVCLDAAGAAAQVHVAG